MILDCQPVADRIKSQLLSQRKTPRVAIVHSGFEEGQNSYIKNILKQANELNIMAELHDLNSLKMSPYIYLDLFNENTYYDAIMPIRPFTSEIDAYLREKLNPRKDVDNFTGKSNFNSCTAEGVLEILNYHNIDYKSKKVLVIGRNEGKSVFDLLTQNDATCTLAHSKTPRIINYTVDSDIIITCTGQKNLITNNIIKDDTVIIDVGRGEVEESLYTRENVWVTPRIKGTGLVTTMKLMEHIYECCDK